jgi:DNA-binding Xre family transcriptional regulator
MNNNAIGGTFESFLDEEDIRQEVESIAVKKIIAVQIQEILKETHMTKTELADKLETSRAAVNRLLDPYNESITLHTLKRAASLLGRNLKVELV